MFKGLIKHFIIAVILGFLIFVTYLVVHLGAMKSPTMTVTEEGPMILVFKEHRGAYHQIRPVIEEVEKWAKENGIDCSKSFGEYLDVPGDIDEERLRSNGGCVVATKPTALPEGFKIEEYPVRRYLKSVFEGSPAIGPWKVYGPVKDHMLENKLVPNGPVIEVYKIISEKEMTTTYYFPIE